MADQQLYFSRFCRRVVRSRAFQPAILFIVISAAALVGFETYPGIRERHGTALIYSDAIVAGLFLAEMIIRIGAYGRHWLRFFRDGWNIFDFVIVVVCILPYHTGFVAVLRLLRILRILRLISAMPRLQMLVGALLKSIPSIGHISLLLFLHFYVYACIGTFLFQGNDPVHFGSLHQSMLSLFQVVTLEGWNDIMRVQLHGSDVWDYPQIADIATHPKAYPFIAPIYFVSFILFGTMIVLNLFIGVILNGMDEMQAEHDAKELEERRRKESLTMADEIHLLTRDLEQVQHQLFLLRLRLNQRKHKPRRR